MEGYSTSKEVKVSHGVFCLSRHCPLMINDAEDTSSLKRDIVSFKLVFVFSCPSLVSKQQERNTKGRYCLKQSLKILKLFQAILIPTENVYM